MSDTDFKPVHDAGGSKDDGKNLLSLIKELRDALGSKAIITLSSQAGRPNYIKWPLKEIGELASWYNVMVYGAAIPLFRCQHNLPAHRDAT